MTQEQKQLLLKDLCARLPYGVKCHIEDNEMGDIDKELTPIEVYSFMLGITANIKPYLRPMSSMTEEEVTEFISVNVRESIKYQLPNHEPLTFWECSGVTDWLNEHHFDYRGLIDKGLALEAPEDMYKTV